ncbi:MAG: NAD(P)-dependent alcohol dehydrogenase [Bacteroides sp.]|nr:NAD(P)-dependent alcohol dehydrogenase [Bacteroides sp.]MCM1447036.1 NAD(P)-dependent alcohol dehydrogenase [Bacteroides sp.]
MNKKMILTAALAIGTTGASFAQQADNTRIPAKGFAVYEAKGHFKPYEFSRHAVGDNDIQIEILYAGICHSDLHHVFADWGTEEYPMVPGHEIAGRVVAVGKNVTKFKVGDYAGIGCMIGSCRHCEACEHDMEQYCEEGAVMTYHGIDRFNGNEHTQGGYSDTYVVAEDFAIKVPANAKMEKVAPLLCAGITSYSPIMQAGVKKGDKVGIAGFGGLGHMGVQYAVSLGAEVTVFDITEDKRADAMRMGAVRYVNVNNPEELKGLDGTFDFILSTIPAKYEPAMYLKMLKLNGQLGIVGIPAFRNMPALTVADIVFQGSRRVFGSQIGGIKETQEMLGYSVEHDIYPKVEIIHADGEEIDKAYQNVQDGKVKFRYVIDMKTLK